MLATWAAIGCLLHTHHINHLAAVAAAGLIGVVGYKIDSVALAADRLPPDAHRSPRTHAAEAHLLRHRRCCIV